MKLIIDIPEDVYTRLFDNGIQDNEIAVDDVCEMARALRMGTPYEERPKGEWLQIEIIDDDYEYGVNDNASECSNCKHVESSHYWTTTYYHYCPNCGARMGKDHDNE